MLAPHFVEPDATDLESEIDSMPGGRWIKPHYTDGPYRLVVVDDIEDRAHPHAWAALRAYPAKYLLPCWTTFDEVRQVSVHVVPDFVHQLLFWHTDEYNFGINEDFTTREFPTMPTEEELVAELAALLPATIALGSYVEVEDAVTAAVTTVGLPPVLRLLSGLARSVIADGDAVVAALEGVTAAAS